MPSCCIPGCNTSQLLPGVSFHAVPVNELQRKAWIQAVGNDLDSVFRTSGKRVCNKHFVNSDFEYRWRGSRFIHCLKTSAVPSVTGYINSTPEECTEHDCMDPSLEEQMEQQIDEQRENINDSDKVSDHCYGFRCANPACISNHKQLTATVTKLKLEVMQLRRELTKFSSKSVVDAGHSRGRVLLCYQKPWMSEAATVECNISTQTRPSFPHNGQTVDDIDNIYNNCQEAWDCRPSVTDACGTITAGLVAVIPSLIGASSATISGITIGPASASPTAPSKRRRMLSQSDATLTHDAATQSEVLSVGTAAVDTQCLAQCCEKYAGTCVNKPILKSIGVSCRLLTVPDTLTSSPSVSTPVIMQDSNFMCQPIESEDLQHERQRVIASRTLIRADLDASVSSRPNCRSVVVVQRKEGLVLVPVLKNSVVQCKESPAIPT